MCEVINAPSYFVKVWNVVSLLIAPATRKHLDFQLTKSRAHARKVQIVGEDFHHVLEAQELQAKRERR